MALRVIFMGTPDLASASLRRLLESPECEVVAVVTQPDRPKGRDLKLQPSPVKQLALASGKPVLQPLRAREPGFFDDLRGLRPELIAVAAFGQILPTSILELPRLGCINLHTSLLPKYRGAAPIQWAILNGDSETGVTIMKMDAGLDTGDILTQASTPIGPDETAESLHDRLATLGADLLMSTIRDYAGGLIKARPQPAEGAVYAPKIRKQDGLVDWEQPARTILNRLRGLTPWPGIFTSVVTGGRPHILKIWRAEVALESGAAGVVLRADKSGILMGCGEASLRILELQLEGARRLAVREFLAGHRLEPGHRLGERESNPGNA